MVRWQNDPGGRQDTDRDRASPKTDWRAATDGGAERGCSHAGRARSREGLREARSGLPRVLCPARAPPRTPCDDNLRTLGVVATALGHGVCYPALFTVAGLAPLFDRLSICGPEIHVTQPSATTRRAPAKPFSSRPTHCKTDLHLRSYGQARTEEGLMTAHCTCCTLLRLPGDRLPRSGVAPVVRGPALSMIPES
ncbi:hypothetical protein BC628DRAFT_1359164 [Trametes gibbosa]|nr:hypothetical protein BC628DRAFT_1359164 [Trametes gibbosa]